MSDITDIPDSEHMFIDDRLNLQALKNKRILDKSTESREVYSALDKRELLELLLKSTVLLHMGAEHIAAQRTDLNRYMIDKINSQ